MNEALISAMQNCLSEISDKLRQMLTSTPPDAALVRLESPLPSINLKGWLSRQQGTLKAYWQDRDHECQIAALGRSWSRELVCHNDIEPAFTEARQLLACLPEGQKAQCLSYLSFSDSAQQVWSEFGYGVVFLPLLELVETRKNTLLAVNIPTVGWQHYIEEALQVLSSLKHQQRLENTAFQLSYPSHLPDQSQWDLLLDRALTEFSNQHLEKVVLSRKSEYVLSGRLSPWYLMQKWQQANPRSYNFVFEGKDGEMFLGCSPEKLIKRQGNIITTEALAGTARRGASQNEDFQLEVLLMNDRKNIHENRIVLSDIRYQLAPLCRALETDRSHSVLKLKTVQHLRYLIRGVIHEQVSDAQLITALHPTPAVGGTPRKSASEFIEHNEYHCRGLYAGACGVLGVDRSEFCVAIRSARLTSEKLALYAGAGIVKGSNSHDEWQELNNKVATISEILQSIQEKSTQAKNVNTDDVQHCQA